MTTGESNRTTWLPATEDDLRRAIADHTLEETHFWDFKRQLGTGGSANKNLAQDMAAMAVDGGYLLIGLEEVKASGEFTLAPQPTANLRERIEAVAATAIDPPLDVRVMRIPADHTAPGEEPLGYLVIEIHPSPRAPHQVNGVYYGRGETGNRRLPDAEVQRLHAARASQASRAEALLARDVARDPIPVSNRKSGHLYLIAEPLAVAPDSAVNFLRGAGIETWIQQNTALYDAPGLSAGDRHGLEMLGHVERRGNGWANTTQWLSGTGRAWQGNSDDPSVERYLMDIEFLNDGGIHCLIGQATITDNQDRYVSDRRIVVFTRRLIRWAAEYGQQIGHRGSWLLGIHVNGLRGLRSWSFAGPAPGIYYAPPRPCAPTYSPPRYSDDTYQRVTTATTQALNEHPGEVTAQLVQDLAWALGTADQFDDIFSTD